MANQNGEEVHPDLQREPEQDDDIRAALRASLETAKSRRTAKPKARASRDAARKPKSRRKPAARR